MRSTTAPSEFSLFVGQAIHSRRTELARSWVRALEERLETPLRKRLPSDGIINHIPAILERVADFVADPGEALLEALVVDDLTRLAELRRQQGYSPQELLQEYQVFSEIIQDAIEDASEAFEGEATLADAVRTTGRLKDAIYLLGAMSVRSRTRWADRWELERYRLLEGYGQVLGHELGNRLGAAETAAQLLQTDLELSAERRDQLHQLIVESVQGGIQTIKDVDALSRPLTEETQSIGMSLPLLVNESVRLARATATGQGVRIRTKGSIPDVQVPGPPVRLALSNLLNNAMKYHRSEGDDRWIEVRVRVDGSDATIVVEDNGPGIPDAIHEKIFRHNYRGKTDADGSGLGLAITRDALSRVDGSMEVVNSPSGGATFTVCVSRTDSEDASTRSPRGMPPA